MKQELKPKTEEVEPTKAEITKELEAWARFLYSAYKKSKRPLINNEKVG